jgi:hypothetical protein
VKVHEHCHRAEERRRSDQNMHPQHKIRHIQKYSSIWRRHNHDNGLLVMLPRRVFGGNNAVRRIEAAGRIDGRNQGRSYQTDFFLVVSHQCRDIYVVGRARRGKVTKIEYQIQKENKTKIL